MPQKNPREKLIPEFVVDKGDVIAVKAVVVDAHDKGNIVLELDNGRTFLASVAQLEAGRVSGGRHVLRHPESGQIVEDPAGKLGPTTVKPEILKALADPEPPAPPAPPAAPPQDPVTAPQA